MPCLANMKIYLVWRTTPVLQKVHRNFSLKHKCEDLIWLKCLYSTDPLVLQTNQLRRIYSYFTHEHCTNRFNSLGTGIKMTRMLHTPILEPAAYSRESYISSSVKPLYKMYTCEACYIWMAEFVCVTGCVTHVSGTSRQVCRVPIEQANFSPRSWRCVASASKRNSCWALRVTGV